MRWDFVCIAGIDPDTGRHVRPVLRSGQIPLQHAQNGPFRLGEVVDLGQGRPVGQAPEVEDVLIDPDACRALGRDPALFWALNDEVTRGSLADIFGGEITIRGRSAIMPPLRGRASLGILNAPVRSLRIVQRENRRPQVRAGISVRGTELDLSVTDLRLFETGEGEFRVSRKALDYLEGRINRGARYTLAVGLTRAMSGFDDMPNVHWLQVNGIHLRPQRQR